MLTVYLVVGMLLMLAATGPRRLIRLATLQIRHVWLLWLALADQIVVISIVPESNATVLAAAHIASYLMAGVWLVANSHLPGGWLIGLGGTLNGIVITLNGGTLPASESAVRAAGQVADTGRFTNSQVLADPVLPWLGDVFATPAWIPGQNVFSLGDVLIWTGLMIFLWRTCRPGVRPIRRHARRAPMGYQGRHGHGRAPVALAPPAMPAALLPRCRPPLLPRCRPPLFRPRCRSPHRSPTPTAPADDGR